jgi:predicted nucleic acid-binding protein
MLSFMTVIELLSWKEISSQINLIQNFLSKCIIKDNEPLLQQKVIETRLEYGLKIPDAFIAATALYHNLTLISGDPIFKRIKDLDLLFIEF